METKHVNTPYKNGIDYLRRRKGLTWQDLARQVDCSFPALMREAQMQGTRQIPSGGGLGSTRRARLAQVLGVEVWHLSVPPEQLEKILPIST